MTILTPTPETPRLAGAPDDAGHLGLPGPAGPEGIRPAWPDPAILQQLANAFFQGGPAGAAGAPHVPAQPPVGPPDLPPVTIPSVVPTPNIPAPGAPIVQALPGAVTPPQPGGSPGSFGATGFQPFDFSTVPAGLGEVLSLVPQRPVNGPAVPPAIPDAVAQRTEDGFYFLRDGESVAQPPAASELSERQADPSSPAAARPDFRALPAALRPELVPDVGSGARHFDPHSVKRDFPILQETVHGKPLIWLDNAATTQKPQSVIDRLSHFYEHENSNIHRAAHTLAGRATDAYEAAREKVRRFLNAGSTKDIIFVRGATEAINLVAQTYGRRHVREGDEIVVTHLEHHANIVPWQQLAAEKGAKLRVAPVDDTGQVIVEEFERLLGPRTAIVAIAQVSNALGTVVPVRELTAIAHRYGAKVLVDGAQSVSHMAVDVQAIDADFFVFSGHKIFGPTGIGVVYGKPDVLATLPPWQGGGNMIADVTFEKTIYNPPPERFEAGTGNIADAVGLGAAIDYVQAIGMEVIARYEHELLVYATEHLVGIPGLRLIGTAREKASVLSFVLDGCRTQDVGAALDRDGIAVRAGHHCAQPILRRFGVESTVRPSLAFYNTKDDINALITALLRIQSSRGYGPRSH